MSIRELLSPALLARHRRHGFMRGGVLRADGWYAIRDQGDDRAVVELYDVISEWGVSAQQFVRDLRAITAPTIELHINSPGGLFYDGLTIFNALRDHPARVEAIVDGLAASAASFILQAAEHRTMNRHSELMIHDALMVTIGNAADHLESVAQLDRVSDNIASIYAERAGGDPAGWREAMRAETWYSAAEATDAGLSDETVSDADESSNTAPRSRLVTARARAYRERAA